MTISILSITKIGGVDIVKDDPYTPTFDTNSKLLVLEKREQEWTETNAALALIDMSSSSHPYELSTKKRTAAYGSKKRGFGERRTNILRLQSSISAYNATFDGGQFSSAFSYSLA